MTSLDRDARIAGALYALLCVTGPFSLLYVPGRLIVRGDAAVTGTNILAHELLFRSGIAVNLIGTVIFILVGAALYRLLERVDRAQAALMLIFVLMSVPIAFVNELNNLAALFLFRDRMDALAMLFIRLHGQGIVVAEMFWGLWLVPFAVLVYRSRFIPRILGVLLFVNGLTYIALSVLAIVAPPTARALDRYAAIPETGELWIMLWLLLKGAKE